MPEDVYRKNLEPIPGSRLGISGPEQCELDWVFIRKDIRVLTHRILK
jgi:hypothetical protein